jgi:hypothetical protein
VSGSSGIAAGGRTARYRAFPMVTSGRAGGQGRDEASFVLGARRFPPTRPAPSGEVQRIALASPDKTGGAGIALVCVLIEAAGQALIWLAPWSTLTFIGAALTGFGYPLVYPGFGAEAVRRAPPQRRN